MMSIKIYKENKIYFGEALNDDFQEYLYQEIEYDDNHNVVTEITYNNDGNVVSSVKRRFNSDNRLVYEYKEGIDVDTEISEYVYFESLLSEEKHMVKDVYEEKYVYKYNNDNFCVSKEHFGDEDMELDKKIMTYEGNLLTKIENDEDGELCIETIYKYDDKGNKIEEIYYTLEGKKLLTEFAYNDRKLLVKTIAYNEFGSISSVEENIYDDKNRIIKTTIKTPGNSIFYVYEYNEKDQLFHQLVSDLNYIYQETTNFFDDNNIISADAMVFTPKLNKKEISHLRYEY